jgi:hypothetical protein
MQVGNGSRTELESALVLKGSCFPREETAVRVVGTKRQWGRVLLV